MSTQLQRICAFKRCPDTEYVPRQLTPTPISLCMMDLNDWAEVAALKYDILEHMSYLESGVQSIDYHLSGEGCSMQRPLEAIFDDPVLHAPERHDKHVMLHLETESNQAAPESQEEVAKLETTISGKVEEEVAEAVKTVSEKVTLELEFNQGENYDPETKTWDSVTPYAWNSELSIIKLEVEAKMLVSELPERFRKEILQRAHQDECFTNHYLHDHKSNVMFTSAITIDGDLVSLEGRVVDEQTVLDLVGENDGLVHATVVMAKIKISGTPTPDMTLDAVRPVSTEKCAALGECAITESGRCSASTGHNSVAGD